MGRCKHLAICIFKYIKHIALHNMLLGLSQFVISPFFTAQRPDILTVEDLKQLRYLECVIKVMCKIQWAICS